MSQRGHFDVTWLPKRVAALSQSMGRPLPQEAAHGLFFKSAPTMFHYHATDEENAAVMSAECALMTEPACAGAPVLVRPMSIQTVRIRRTHLGAQLPGKSTP